MPRTARARPPVDNRPLARQIGERLKRARIAASLTQQQLADGRYTKAYVSALENGLSRPSMAALQFFSERLGISPGKLINDEPPAWARLEADLSLASGDWSAAVSSYGQLLETSTQPETRAELLLGLAEALGRLGKGREVIAAASEAAHLFRTFRREREAALAEYWLASGQYQQENPAEARSILRGLLERVRAGFEVEPDFELRLVMAISSVEAREGNHASALAYLEEVRNLASQLDDRRRAVYLMGLAYNYREVGDLEAAVRVGTASLELFRRVEADREMAQLENDIALSYLALGNTARAAEMAANAARHFERDGDGWWLCHVLETQSRIALARGETQRAADLAARSVALAESTKNWKGLVDALLAVGRAYRALGDGAHAVEACERAAAVAKETGSSSLIRHAYGEWADALEAMGDHDRAFGVLREGLSAV